MNSAVIVDAVRSPMGRGKAEKGALSGLHPARPSRSGLRRPPRPHRSRPRDGRRRAGRLRQPGRRAVRHPRAAGVAGGRVPDLRSLGDDRTQVRLRPAGRRVRGGGHRRRAVRHRGRRRRRVDEPGADGLGADGRRPVRAVGARALPRPRPAGRLRGAGGAEVGTVPGRAGRVRRALAPAGRGRVVRGGDRAGRWRQGRRDDPPRHDRGAAGPVAGRLSTPTSTAPASPPSSGWSPPATRRRSPTARARCC